MTVYKVRNLIKFLTMELRTFKKFMSMFFKMAAPVLIMTAHLFILTRALALILGQTGILSRVKKFSKKKRLNVELLVRHLHASTIVLRNL